MAQVPAPVSKIPTVGRWQGHAEGDGPDQSSPLATRLYGASVEACCLEIAGGVEDGCGYGFAGVDEAGGGVCLEAEGFAG